MIAMSRISARSPKASQNIDLGVQNIDYCELFSVFFKSGALF
jgi:hypothetical protein